MADDEDEVPDASANAPPNDELQALRSSRRVSQNDSNIRRELAKIFGGGNVLPDDVPLPPLPLLPPLPPPPPPQPPPLPVRPPSVLPPLAAAQSDELRHLCERIAQKVDRLEELVAPPIKPPPPLPRSTRRGRTLRKPRDLERSLHGVIR